MRLCYGKGDQDTAGTESYPEHFLFFAYQGVDILEFIHGKASSFLDIMEGVVFNCKMVDLKMAQSDRVQQFIYPHSR